ncbi:meprin and TRAF domain-containing protein [Heterostelium album PN500]|uniref:ubiquitinyl hydrolase 1 n=1 Tax=Heterostelium pallidum (strain ATCC 26659 / Pp 5 / PN500) TaxID=670386 RepID=D3B796_HETP5|nr:meprin and TRAF domain-containing protein [Heterostelium album PN500]EFA82639.1 meprin and TRAF domain-containing protein [Heterostelium album PN500]|eukprot:XP_020434756.1 meprin and TRAF domain-containing protein [Heterostelium album PN500]
MLYEFIVTGIFGSVAVSTKELTKSFGWGTHDIFTQHDVQELNRVLCDNLNEKMKGTKAEGTIDNLFRGKIKNFIKCETVKYESKREEEFYDLSLNVKGCSTIHQSFEKYVEVERLDGSNKYDAEGFGLQVANKGCRFLSFPPVLHLQLKRFEYDPIRDANVKVNDRYTFPEVLDLTPYLDEEADKSLPSIYHLQGVLVHSGDLHNGHYYAFMKPSMDGEWLKFDDEDVSKCTFTQVTEESFGAEVDPTKRMPFIRNFTNAYMLIYLREKESNDLLKPIPDSDIPEHLKQRIESDEKKTNNQYFRIKLTTDEDFVNNPGFDLADFTKVQFQMIPLKPGEVYNVAYLKRQITTLIGIPPERQRIWSWFVRRNKTLRIDLTPEYDETSLAEIRDKFRQQEIRLYLEVSYIPRSLNMTEQNSYFQPIAPTLSNGLIFFKYYNPQTTTMKFVGSRVIDLNWKASHIVPILNQLAGLPQNTNIALYEELSESDIEPLKLSETLKKLEIQNGDIIVFQKPVPINEKYHYPTTLEYFDYIKHKTTVKFKQVENNSVNFTLELSKDMKYPEITNIISQQIKVDANKIRLLTGPKYYGSDFTPIKPNDNIPLKDILLSGQRSTDQLYFEVLNIPVSECESKRNFKVNWLKPNYEYEKVSIWVPKIGDVSDIKKTFVDIIAETMPDIPAMNVDKLKLLEIRSHRVDRELKDEFIAQIMDNINLKIEAISEEELNRSPTDKLVQVVHFSNDSGFTSYHSIPFLLIIKEEESFAQIRTRIQARLGTSVSPNEFARWKLAIIQDEKPKLISDDTIVSKGSDWNNVMLGLLHHPALHTKHNQKAIKINK